MPRSDPAHDARAPTPGASPSAHIGENRERMRIGTITRAGAAGLALGSPWLLGACQSEQRALPTDAPAALVAAKSTADDPSFVDRSVTPALVKNVRPGVTVTTLLSSDDVLPGSPKFVFGGSADGAGLLRTAEGYTLLVNNEDNWAVSRVALDRRFAPIAGDYAINSTNGMFRLCSAVLATPAEHGFGPLFLTAGESSQESQIRAMNPFAPQNTSVTLPALGRFNAEQALPLPVDAYRGKTVILIGDDDSGPYGGQVAMYVGERTGDLQNGRLYVLARTDDVTRERDMQVGGKYAVEFREVPNQQALTGLQINQKGQELKAVAFGRVEDVDYRKGGTAHGRDVYFAVTGQNDTGVNADGSRSKYGRIYHLSLDNKDPLHGTLEVLLDGDDRGGPAGQFQNPDNITVTKNHVYIQEDPNGYGDETHDARIYDYDLNTKTVQVVLEADHRRDKPDAAKYNVGGLSKLGDWEISGMIDISEQTGEKGTFMVAIQAHTWRGAKYRNPDGGTLRPNEDQASQLVVLRGLPQ